jgi:glycosyltransferase involved in cell wall biosynthesis
MAPIEAQERVRSRERLGIAAGAEVLTFFGYFAGYKGLDVLLDALPELFARRPRLHVVLAGEIPNRLSRSAPARERIARLGEEYARLHVLGFVPEDDVRGVFAASDALVLPYTAAISASGPLSLAAGFGVPALISRYLAADRELAFAFDPTPEGIVRAANAFFGEDAVRSDAIHFVRKLAERQSWDEVAARHANLYARLLQVRVPVADAGM